MPPEKDKISIKEFYEYFGELRGLLSGIAPELKSLKSTIDKIEERQLRDKETLAEKITDNASKLQNHIITTGAELAKTSVWIKILSFLTLTALGGLATKLFKLL